MPLAAWAGNAKVDMSFSRSKRIEQWLLFADITILLAWGVVGYMLPANLQTTLAWVMAIAWYCGLVAVGGQNSLYLHPRRRILVSMSLALACASLAGIFWAGNGHDWYMKGGIHSLVALGVAGTTVRFILAQFLQRPAIQLVPIRLSRSFLPLLEEIAQHLPAHIEPVQDDPAAPLPKRRAGYPIFLAVIDSRLRETDFNRLFPLYAQVEVVDICDLYEALLGKVAIIETPKGWTMPSALRVPSQTQEILKRLRDVFFVLVTLPLTVPILLIAAIVIRLTSKGPIFFVQERLGRYGVPFRLIKLRTMVTDAEAQGPQWAGARDTRVTPLGRFLRVTGIDELPQLWNILRGEMSLVGPRPELPEIVQRLEAQIPFYDARLLAPPGLTGWAQLHQGGDATLEDVANKLRFDLFYLKYGTPLMDLNILLSTAQMLLHLAKPAPKARPAVKVGTSV